MQDELDEQPLAVGKLQQDTKVISHLTCPQHRHRTQEGQVKCQVFDDFSARYVVSRLSNLTSVA
jgi:hypothetical protein